MLIGLFLSLWGVFLITTGGPDPRPGSEAFTYGKNYLLISLAFYIPAGLIFICGIYKKSEQKDQPDSETSSQ